MQIVTQFIAVVIATATPVRMIDFGSVHSTVLSPRPSKGNISQVTIHGMVLKRKHNVRSCSSIMTKRSTYYQVDVQTNIKRQTRHTTIQATTSLFSSSKLKAQTSVAAIPVRRNIIRPPPSSDGFLPSCNDIMFDKISNLLLHLLNEECYEDSSTETQYSNHNSSHKRSNPQRTKQRLRIETVRREFERHERDGRHCHGVN